LGQILIRVAAATLAALAGSQAAAEPAAQPPPQHTITKAQLRADPPAKTHQRLREIVWDMFERQDMRRKARPVARLSGLALETRLRGTRVPNLCRYDSVIVEFAPDVPGRGDADTPVHAVGLHSSSQHYAFLAPPTQPYDKAADYKRLPSDSDCSGLKGRYQLFFTADRRRPPMRAIARGAG
jgi:hypothetical protein